MAESLTATIATALNATLSNPVSDGTASFVMNQAAFINGTLSNGNGANQANQLYDEIITLAASGTVTIDCHAFASATDQLGQTRALTKLKYLGLLLQGSLNCTVITSGVVNAAGTGYLVNDVLTVAGGTGTAAKFTVTGVGGGGAITSVALAAFSGFTGGSYTAAPSLVANAVTGGTGTTATLNLTAGSYLLSGGVTPVFIDTDFLSLGGDGATSALTSLFGTNTDKFFIYGGTNTLPGSLQLTGGGATAWTVGASTTNKNIKITNGGSNPITFRLIIIGAT